MSGDRLAQIESRWLFDSSSDALDVLALVEIAKAAQHCVARGLVEVTPEYADLCRALARLDSGADKEDA